MGTGVENLAPTGIRSPDRASHSQSLYRLRYPGPPTGSAIFTNNESFFQALLPDIFTREFLIIDYANANCKTEKLSIFFLNWAKIK
jgi:hypothetical protein